MKTEVKKEKKEKNNLKKNYKSDVYTKRSEAGHDCSTLYIRIITHTVTMAEISDPQTAGSCEHQWYCHYQKVH